MSIDLGTISYSVNVNTEDMERATDATEQYEQSSRQAAGATDVLSLATSKLTRATDGVTSRYQQLRAQIDPTYAAQQRFTRGVQILDAELKQGNISLSRYNADLAALRRSTSIAAQGMGRANRATGGFGGALQQAGFQIGDFAVQVGAGQNAMVAFAQQGSQLAGIFGPAGALAGAVIAIGGALAGGFFRGTEKASEGAETLTDRLKALDLATEDYTEAQIEAARVELWRDNRQRLANIREEEARIRSLTKEQREYRIALDEAIERRDEVREAEYRQLIRETGEEITLAKGNIATYRAEADKAAEELDNLGNSTDDAGKAEERRREKLEGLIESVEQSAITTNMSARATDLHKAAVLGATAAELEAINAAHDRIDALNEQAEAERRLHEATRIRTEDDPLLGAVGAQDRGQQIIAEMQKEARAVERGLDKRLALEEAHARRVEALRGGFRSGAIESEERLNQLIVLSAEERNERIKELEQNRSRILTESQENTLSVFGDLFGNLADIAKEGGEDQFQTWKNLASAQAAVSTALAVANALTAAPPPFNYALAASVGALGAVQIAKIQNQEYQAARRYGGQIQPNQNVLVGEDGPEVLRMGGGTAGHVTPNHKLGGQRIDQNLVFQLPVDANKEAKRVVAESVPMIRQVARQAVLEAISEGGSMTRAVGRRR